MKYFLTYRLGMGFQKMGKRDTTGLLFNGLSGPEMSPTFIYWPWAGQENWMALESRPLVILSICSARTSVCQSYLRETWPATATTDQTWTLINNKSAPCIWAILIWGEGVNADLDGLGHLYQKVCAWRKSSPKCPFGKGGGRSKGIWAVPKLTGHFLWLKR